MGIFGDAADWVSDTASAAWDEVEDVYEDAKDDVEDLANDVADSGRTFFDRLISSQGVLGFFGNLFGGIGAFGLALAGHLVDFQCDVLGWGVHLGFVIVGDIVGTIVSIFDRDTGQKIMQGAERLGNFGSAILDGVGDVLEGVTDFLAMSIYDGIRALECIGKTRARVRRRPTDVPEGFNQIEHFIVVVLENRSFDHMLGHWDTGTNAWLINPGVDGVGDGYTCYGVVPNPPNPQVGASTQSGAADSLSFDPPHGFDAVQAQIAGPMTGFVQSYFDRIVEENSPYAGLYSSVMDGFAPRELPALHHLAAEYAVCDRWFCSVPGPTVPNRLFIYGGTSGGLADSPKQGWMVDNEGLAGFGPAGFKLKYGSIFDRLTEQCVSWRLAAGDQFPLALLLDKMIAHEYLGTGSVDRSDGIRHLVEDLAKADKDFPTFVFVEPDYGRWYDDYTGGTSQHPLGSAKAGDNLVKAIYEALVNSPIWERSALIITYDEHGGFFDHVEPPAATPPGDGHFYASEGDSPASRDFRFDRLGVRVPAIVVSPWIDAQVVHDTTFDHASIMATVYERLGLLDQYRQSNRVTDANSLSPLFSRKAPRPKGGDSADACPLTLGPAE